MNSFLSEISNVKNTLNVINITWKDIKNIQDSILKEQNLKDLNELRDKFEGITYYNAIHKKIAGVIALEKLLKKQFIKWENIKPKTYKPIIIINGTKFLVISSLFGTLPTIPKNNTLPIILTIIKEERAIWIIGFMYPEDFEQVNNFKAYKTFISLDDFELKS